MTARVIDGFEVWAEANQVGDDPAVPYVVTKDKAGKVPTKRFTVVTLANFRSLEDAQSAAKHVVQGVTSVSASGVPSPLIFRGLDS